MKIFIPLLVLALILGGLYTYFFMLAPDTTASILMHWGSNAIDHGHYYRAIQLYAWAYDLDANNVGLAFSLANAYSGTGNYTKAEYVLMDSIRLNPENAALYKALSQVFVAQDKLLDAQRLLDDGIPPSVQAELQAERPGAPEFSIEPGYYSEYVPLQVTAPSGTVYVSLDNEYPSIASGIFSGATLPSGTTTVTAIAVGENGLVSPLVSGEFTISGVVEEVNFQDPKLEASIREMLYKSPDQRITTDELWTITELAVPEDVTTLEDLQYFIGLTSLTIPHLPETDFAFLQSMPDLTTLDLSGCALVSEQLVALDQLPALKQLYLANCGLSTISPLAALTQVEILDLSDNYISDLSPLRGCTALAQLNLSNNGVTDLSPLTACTQLRILNLSSNALTDAAPLSQCGKLEELDLSSNQLTTVDCIASMPYLRIFTAAQNQLTEISAISSCAQLERLDVSENKLESIGGVENILTLTYLNLDYNDVKTLPEFAANSTLQQFYAAHNYLENIDGLSGLQELNYVDVDYNNVSSLDALLDCPRLVQINAFGTNVEDISAFDPDTVIINYNPT